MSSTAFFAGGERAGEVLLLVVRDGEQVIRSRVRGRRSLEPLFECRRALAPLLFLHEELRALITGLVDLLRVQAARVDGALEVAASLLILVLRVGDVEQDLLDLAALVRAQLVELQRADLLAGAGVVLHVQELDRLVEDLARLRVDARRSRCCRRRFLFIATAGSARALL